MKATKFATAVLVASLVLATGVNASSIGRSGGSSSSHSSSSASRSSSVSAPSRPAPSVAPAPSKPGGIGGNTQGSSVGVRKSEVTQPVAQQVRPATPSNPAPTSTGAGAPAAPTYSSPSPVYSQPSPVTNGSTFMSSLGGSFAGTVLGNMIFGGHGHGGGTTVINNGAAGVPSSSGPSAGPGIVAGDQAFNPGGVSTAPKKEYTVWSFIGDLFGFVIVVALLIGIAWLFYKGFQLVRNYVNKERGVSTQPFNPTQQFWTIQKAFAAADVTALQGLLGPDVVDELTNGLTASTVTLHNVSHEVRLSNNTEFSIWYTFEDAGETINQVWHYEKFGKDWKLNGIETV
jgi:hypothetical protein